LDKWWYVKFFQLQYFIFESPILPAMRTITLNVPEDYDYRSLLELLNGLGIGTENLHTEPRLNSGEERKRILNKLAAMGGLSQIEDPVAWQRDVRKDRDLG